MNKRPFGFTLLETLIALSLVIVLMGLSWSLFATFSRLDNRARKAVASLEITRSFRRQFQNDLDQLVNSSVASESSQPTSSFSFNEVAASQDPVLEPTGGLDLANLSGPVELEPSSQAAILPSAEFPVGTLLEGTNQSLSFLIRTDKNSTLFEDEEFLVITYAWRDHPDSEEPGSEIEGPSDLESDELGLNEDLADRTDWQERIFVRTLTTYRGYQSKNAFHSSEGLDGELDAIETIQVGRPKEETGLDPKFTREEVDLIPEISRIEFKYFDGRSWAASWNREGLPIAIEVVYSVKSEIDQRPNSNGALDEDELDFGSELEIGESELQIESASGNRGKNIGQPIEDFDPDSYRFLVRIGTQVNQGTYTDSFGQTPNGVLIEEEDFR